MSDDPNLAEPEDAPRSVRLTEVIGAGFAVLWVTACTIYLFGLRQEPPAPPGTLELVAIALAVAMPLILIWVAVNATRQARVAREIADETSETLAALRKKHIALQQTQNAKIVPSATTALAPPAAGDPADGPSQAFAMFATRRQQPLAARAEPAKPAPLPLRETEEQGSLALDGPGARTPVPVSVDDFITAINFPKTAEDREGFRSLKRAMADPYVNRLIQASQDVLTLLSQEGIYMDDLAPDRARPEIWRKFAYGERGRTVAMLGGVRDRSSLALSAQRMRQDHIFRDAAHHFLRQFDKTFTSFEKSASDEDIVRLSDTRTARAFMLLGRVAGTFD